MPHSLSLLAEHPQRLALTEEVHARPYEMMPSPARASFIAMVSGEGGGEADRQAVSDLCKRFSVEPPAADAVHYSVDLGPFRLRWERHTEFSTYGFIQLAPFEEPFTHPVIEQVPGDWLCRLPGEALVAIHVAVEDRRGGLRDLAELAPLFGGHTVAGSVVTGGGAKAWTDFRIHGDGFSRILVEDLDLRSRQVGRLVQRLVEIETYRMLALLAFPEARKHGRVISDIDARHAALTEQVTRIASLEDEQQLLGDLSRLAAEVERIATATSYRFSAAEAYYALVERRIEELREERIEGVQTFREFMDRRLAPAMRTCQSVRRRLETLSDRLNRTGSLLRARVNLALEQQNRDLLDSMNRRARLQLRLQQTVEGLSVVVLSYYSVGLVGYAAKAVKAAGYPVNADLVTGISIPLVVAAVFLGVHRMKGRLARDGEN
ncbi:MAG: DUF3422 domain-containing protein [Gammaproteobacteria bacterium]